MRALISTLVVICGGATPAVAQWYLRLELATTAYHGASHDTSGTHVASEGRPGGGPAIGIRIDRNWHRIGVALRMSYANPGFAVAGHGVSVHDKTTGRLLELASLLSTRVGGIGPSGAVRVEMGPALLLWDFGGEGRTRLGALAAAAYEWPIAGRFAGAVRLEGMLGPSWFDATDVPPDFERRVTWRYGVGLGLRYRLT